MSTETLVIILVVILLLGGGGGYYMGPWRGSGAPNHLIGILVTIIVIVLLLRLLGIY